MNSPVGIYKVYCTKTTDSWVDETVFYNSVYNNEDKFVFAVCKYFIYKPTIMNKDSKIDI